ncbi:hypothetical protein B7463_g1936, partial [Scytalidium lignicola]
MGRRARYRVLSSSPTGHCTVCRRDCPAEYFLRRRQGGLYNICSDCKERRRQNRDRAVLGELDVNALWQTRQAYNTLPPLDKRRRLN